MNANTDADTGTDGEEPLKLYEVTVTVEYTETFDRESQYKEAAEEFGEHIVSEDLAQGDIPVDAMDISAQAMEVH